MLLSTQLIGFGKKRPPFRYNVVGQHSGSGDPSSPRSVDWSGVDPHGGRRLFALLSTRRSNDNVSNFGSLAVTNGSNSINLTAHRQDSGASGSQDRSNTVAIWSAIVPSNDYDSLTFSAPAADGWGMTLVGVQGLLNSVLTDVDGAGTSSGGGSTGDITLTNLKDGVVMAVATGYGGAVGSWSSGTEIGESNAGGCVHSAMIIPRNAAQTDAVYSYSYGSDPLQRSWAGITWS